MDMLASQSGSIAFTMPIQRRRCIGRKAAPTIQILTTLTMLPGGAKPLPRFCATAVARLRLGILHWMKKVVLISVHLIAVDWLQLIRKATRFRTAVNSGPLPTIHDLFRDVLVVSIHRAQLRIYTILVLPIPTAGTCWF